MTFTTAYAGDLRVSTSESVHVFYITNGNNVKVGKNAVNSNTAGRFAFYAVNGVENAYYIYSLDEGKWFDYPKADGYSDKKGFITLSDTKDDYFRIEKCTTYNGHYQIRPYNNTDVAGRYLNYYQGADNSNTLGLYGTKGDNDAGSRYLFEEVICDIKTFENGSVYTFVTERGWMGAKDGNNNVISTVYTANGVTGSATDANFQWTVYKSETEKYYLYNIGKGQFMGVQSVNNTAVPFVETPAGNITFKKSNSTAYPIMFSTDNAAVVNHSGNHQYGLISWTGGWNNLGDPGSNHEVKLIDKLDDEALDRIAQIVAVYEKTPELNTAIANAEAKSDKVGSAIGLYAYNGNYADDLNAIKAFRDAISASTTMDEVNECMTTLNAMLATLPLNTPQTGKYYRLKNAVSNNYMSANADGSVVVITNGANAASTIFYLEEGNVFRSYTQNKYLDSGNKNLSDSKKNGLFEIAYNGPVKNTIAYKNNSYWVFGNRNDGVSIDRGSNKNSTGYNWIVEEVEFIPKKINAGYYTISCDGKYVSDDRVSDNETQRILTDGPVKGENIFYYDGQALIGYASGCGFEYTVCNTGAVGAQNFFEFFYKESDDKYIVKSSAGNSTKGYANGYWRANENGYLERDDNGVNLSFWTLTPVAMTAQIGDKYYYTLAEAVKAAGALNTAVEITLLADYTGEAIELPIGVTLVDSNGNSVTNDKITVKQPTCVYNFVYNGKKLATEDKDTVTLGSEFPNITTAMPFGVSGATKPDGTVAYEDVTIDNNGNGVVTKDINVEINLPFEFADIYDNITKWYYMNIHNDGYCLSNILDNGKMPLNVTTVPADNKNAYSWAFVGNPFTGYQLVNKAAGNGYILSSSTTMNGNTGAGTNPVMTATPVSEGYNTYWVATASNARGENGFFLNQKDYDSNKMNKRDGYLAYWSTGTDAGSTFKVVLRDDAAELRALISEVKEFLNTQKEVSVGYITDAHKSAIQTAVDAAKTAISSENNSDIVGAELALRSDMVFDNTKTIQPEAGKYYTIENVKDYAAKKPIYVAEDNGLSFSEGYDVSKWFKFVTDNNGNIYLYNVKTGKYLSTNGKQHSGRVKAEATTIEGGAKPVTITNMGLANIVKIVPVGGDMIHAQRDNSVVVAWVNNDVDGASAWTIVEVKDPGVAYIDNQNYATLQAAIDNWTEGKTINLLANTDETIVLPKGMKLDVIKLNGFSAPNVKEAPSFTGEGTATSPYIIDNLEKLVALRDNVNSGEAYDGKYFKLTSNITLEGEWAPIGNGSRSSKTYTGNAFKGVFDGDNKTISGLNITSITGNAAVGLFGVVDGGTVKNLNLEVNINVASSDLAGGAIGMMLGGANAENITVNGAIVGNDGVGGIVGRLIIDGTIANCTNNASVTSNYGGIGGIVGKAYYEDGANTATFASITNCINMGTITAPMYVGGIVGFARANVSGCVNEGAIAGGTQTGGIVGQLMAAGTVSANENKAAVSGTNHVGGIIGDYSQNSGSYTYNNVSIANNINRGELSAQQCAAIMGCNNINGFTEMTAAGNVSYYHVEGLVLFGNPLDMVIDATNKFIIPVAQVGTETYYTLAEAVAAAEGATITIINNITLAEMVTIPAGKTLTIDLNGKTVDVAWEDEEAGKHIYALTNNGTLTVTGNGTINTRGIFNYGTMTLTSGTINAIDGNGGYGVRNYAGATFTMNGGKIATTLEDDNKVDKGGYDASPVRVDEGATFTMNGGVINNICDFTVAIDNYGTTIINDGKATTVHTTLANSGTMTINGGEFTCNGIEGITAHALWAAAGETTINGGTFDGKDNYNGFNVDASEGAVVNITGGTFLAVHSGSLYGEGTIAVKGGTFFDNVSERCAAGYVVKQNDNGTYGVEYKPSVAKIGDVEYADLQEAINAANGGTVTLVADVTYTTVYANNKTHWNGDLNYELSVGGNVTLDLNGYTIKSTGGSSHSYYALICVRSGSLTVVDGSEAKNGAIICSAETVAQRAYTIYNNGALVLNGGTVSNTIGNYAIESVTVGETSLTINEGATVTSTGIAVRVCSQGSAGTQTVVVNGGNLNGTYAMWVPVKNGGSDIIDMTINGGTFTGSSNAILFNTYTNGDFTTDKIAIAGGTFNGNVLIGADYADDANHVALSAALAGKVISGGTFSNDVSKYVAKGYALEENDGKFGVVEKAAVAKIGDTEYETLQAAVDAAAEGAVITVLTDIVLEEAVTIPAGKKITIDLNGKVVEYTSAVVGEDMITNYGNLTIQTSAEGGKLTYKNTDTTGSNVTVSTISNCPGAELTINGGTIENTSAAEKAFTGEIFPFAIDNLTNGTSGTAKTTVNGGVIKSNYRSIRLFANSTSDRNTVNINGGEMIGQVWLQAANANAQKVTLVINGGKFAPAGNDASSVYVTTLNVTKPTFRVLGGYFTTKIGTDNATLAANYGIAGGTFTAEAMEKTTAGLVRSGYEFVANENGEYGVDTIKVVAVTDAQGNTTQYATVDAAAKALTDGATITLLKDVTKGINIDGKSVTLDLNGKTMSQNGAAVFVENGGALTIVDSSDAKTGKLTATSDAVTVENSTLVVNGGTIETTGNDDCAISMSYSTVTVNGGKLVSADNGINMIENSASAPNSLTIYGGEIEAASYGIAGNGTYDHSAIVIAGGKIAGTEGGIYHSPEGTLTISGGEISGAKALNILAGTVTVTAGKIVGETAVYYQGANTDYGEINVAISGGEFVGDVTSTAAEGLVAKTGFIKGGSFNSDVTALCVEGFVAKQNDNGTYGVVVDPAYGKAAKIGETYYATLAEAFAAATEAEAATATIELIADLTIDSETYTVADGKNVTLNMNGKKITVTDNKTSNYELFYIYGEMTVTGNGTIELTATENRGWNASSAIFHNRGGVLSVENGTFTHKGGTDMAYVIDNSGNYYGDATTNVKAGTITSTYTAIRNRMEQNSHGASGKTILNISGGTINGTSRAIWAQAASTSTTSPATGEINIGGGEVGHIYTACSAGAVSMTTVTGGKVASFKGEAGELIVNGGEITGDITICNAAGTQVDFAITNEGVYAAAVAKVGEATYATLAEAVAAAQNGETVTLLADVNEAVTIDGKTITLDLNGKKVYGEGTDVVAVSNGANVTIKNGTLETNGKNCGGVWVKNATAVLENCIFIGTHDKESCGVYASNGAIVTINNCVLTAKQYSLIMMGANVTINGGTFAAGVSANGSDIYDDATLTINDGTFGYIYWPANGLLTINGGTFTGETALYVKSGSLEINGGTFTGNGEAKDYEYTLSGYASTGAAVVIENVGTDEYDAIGSVAINGGEFTSVNNVAIQSVTAGKENVEAVTGFITGGTYSSDVTALCVEGFVAKQNDNGTYGVVVDPAYGKVAKIGEAYYATVAEAINAAADGATVQLLAGTIDEVIAPWATDSQHRTEKSITIVGAENYGTTLTGGLYLGYDDSGCREHTITIEGIKFTGKGILVAGQKNVVIKNNKFSEITGLVATSQSATANAISVIGKNVIATVTGNVIADVNSGGIHLRDVADATVTGNTVANTQNNSITINPTAGSNGTITVENNTLSQWGLAGEGRAMRISGGETVKVNGNVMSHTSAPEEFVKVSAAASIDAAANYWNGVNPMIEGMFNSGLATDPATILQSYYTDTEKQNKVEIATSVAKVGNKYYATVAEAIKAAADGATVTVLADVVLAEGVKIVGKTITLDLGGKTVSGTCNAGQSSLVYVENNAALTVKGGKLTYAQGASNIGWTVDVKGAFTLESGTIELTGTWNIGYAVDVRPNSWGTAYTNPTVFTMNGGNIVSSDGAVRVASSSAATHSQVSASFVMNDGTIDAAWDGVFVQQSDAIYDVLNFTMNNGTIKSALNPVRVYGPAATGYVNGQECMNIALNDGTMTYTGNETQTWVIEGILRAGGGSSIETILESGNITAGAAIAQNKTVADGYIWTANNDGTYSVAKTVAKINDVYYASLQAAIDAATEGQIVTIVSDITLTNGVTVAADDSIFIDLNGKTVSMKTAEAAVAALIKNNGTLTIVSTVDGGKLSFLATAPSAANAYASNTISNYGTLTINAGTVENLSAGGACYALDNYAGSTATINGGKLTAEKTAVRVFNWTNGEANAAELNVVGGEIISNDGYGININAGNAPYVALNISGGTITTNDTDYNLAVYVVNKNSAENFTANIEGGIFNGNLALNGVTSTTMVKGNVSVSGGTFDGVICYGEPACQFITGGSYMTEFTEDYLVYGYQLEANTETALYDANWTGYREALTIVDGEVTEFVNAQEITVGTLTYERTGFPVNTWVSLYVPFEIPVSKLTELGYDVAYPNDIHFKGAEDDGVVDEIWAEYIKINAGVLKANFPYMIRANNQEATTMELVLEETTLYSTDTEQTVIECSSAFYKFNFAGTYEAVNRTDIGYEEDVTSCFAVANSGNWAEFTKDTHTLNPFRVYMTMTAKAGAPYIIPYEVMKSIGARVVGEENEDGTTVIYDVNAENGEDVIYDLNGRRVLETEKGGLYIINGKKVLVK